MVGSVPLDSPTIGLQPHSLFRFGLKVAPWFLITCHFDLFRYIFYIGIDIYRGKYKEMYLEK
jgi:hypothetical protein